MLTQPQIKRIEFVAHFIVDEIKRHHIEPVRKFVMDISKMLIKCPMQAHYAQEQAFWMLSANERDQDYAV